MSKQKVPYHKWTHEELVRLYKAAIQYETNWRPIQRNAFPYLTIVQLRNKYSAIKRYYDVRKKAVQSQAAAGGTQQKLDEEDILKILEEFLQQKSHSAEK
ncbi:Myb-like_DNA-binding domain-containing protein [Hexamita inflata]|uniref:Myb-like DNA-binding domain-containing protein n=1 Tax=Hexamita inflata TaxID=28002 RepID=A0AA86NWD4_9EUKA|nr:Myb-like DNA-binding domain-containing protein [Hexamita inflata]